MNSSFSFGIPIYDKDTRRYFGDLGVTYDVNHMTGDLRIKRLKYRDTDVTVLMENFGGHEMIESACRNNYVNLHQSQLSDTEV